MSFSNPPALLLLVPAVLLAWRFGRVTGVAYALRFLLVVLAVVSLAGPVWRREGQGSDVIFVVDRSRSMPPGSLTQATELVNLVSQQRGPGDRVGVVSFGRAAHVEQTPRETGPFGGFSAAVDVEASDLADGLEMAAEVVGDDRRARLIVISDGKASGSDAKAVARRLAARGLVVDGRWLGREDGTVDVAVKSVELPSSVTAGEPFQLSATLMAQTPTEASVTLLRNGQPLAKVKKPLPAGPSVLTFRDLVDAPGSAAYQVRVEAAGDAVVENDVGRGLLRVEGPPRVLLLTDKPSGTLAQTLSAANLQLEVRAPFDVEQSALEGVASVVLEDVEASRLSEAGLRALAQYVEVAGGGLVITGGHHSFGEGGYRKSPIEPLLPVSLEVREEQRKAPIAMSIILDCSCSMGATVPDGRTKMELAAEGVVGALQLLDERDEASVAMVDTSPHVIFDMRSVASGLPLDKVAKGFSGGGGILVGVGLHEGQRSILQSTKPTRHVLLFADASDATDPDDYQQTLAALRAENVTVSVIGMGSPSDSDAKLLREVASRGQGRVYFAEDVSSLPRIFSQETIAVARSSFVEEVTSVVASSDLTLLGTLPAATSSARSGGYNLTYVKTNASVAFRADDQNKAPLLAFGPAGAGKVAAVTLEVDGDFTGDLRRWAAWRAVLERTVRWTMPALQDRPDGVVRATLLGDRAHVTVDFDPRQVPPGGQPKVLLLAHDGRSAPKEVPMQWEEDGRLGASILLPVSGSWHPVVKIGDALYRAPPVTLPWVPEFDPMPAAEGQRWLGDVAKAGLGELRLTMADAFAGLASWQVIALAPPLVALMVVTLVFEVIIRRFFATRLLASRAGGARPSSSAASQPSLGRPPTAIDAAVAAARAKAQERTGRS